MSINKKLFLSIFLFVILTCLGGVGYFFFKKYAYVEYKFVVFVPSYNNAEWCRRNLDSIFQQDYKKYRVIYVDDASTDGTYDLVRQYVSAHNLWSRINVLHNKKTLFVLALRRNLNKLINGLRFDSD